MWVNNAYSQDSGIEEGKEQMSLSSLAHDIISTFDGKDYEATIERCGLMREVLINIGKTSSADYMMAMYFEGRSRYELQQFKEAINCLEQCVHLARKRNVDNDNNGYFSYSQLLLIIAECMLMLPNDAQAVETALAQFNDFVVREYGTNNVEYAKALNNYAVYYYQQNDYNKALDYYQQSISLMEGLNEVDCLDYAILMGNKANCLTIFGNFDESEAIYRNVVTFFQKHLGTDVDDDNFQIHYATALSNLAGCIVEIGKCEEAVELSGRALEIHERYYKKNHPEYVTSFNNHVYCLYRARKVSEAYNRYKEYLNNLNSGWQPQIMCNLWHNLSLCCSTLGKDEEAIDCSLRALEMIREYYGDNIGIYATVLDNLSRSYANVEDYERMYEYSSAYVSMMHQLFLKEFPSMTSADRSQLWKRYSEGFQTWLPKMVMKKNTAEAIQLLYDKGVLFAKGLLLATDIEIRDLLMSSGDSTAISKLDELRASRILLNELYARPIDEREMDAEELERKAERQERELMALSRAYGDMMHNLRLTWRDVRKRLGDKDVAVEFLSFPVSEDTTQYIALTVRKGYVAPHLTKLFTGQELEAVESSYYKEKELSGLVWGRLADELAGVEKIYFSPCGELYGIAIESVPHWREAGMMSDRYELFRLSSTRELAIVRNATPSSGAVVYGGIKYDTDVADMGVPRADTGALYALRGFDVATAGMRGVLWEELKGTLTEANAVCETLRGAKTAVKEYTGTAATETTVKGLTGQKRRLLHIATHGFYWNEDDAEYFGEREKLNFLMTADDRKRTIEDKAMTRSGLLFAGAQNTFNGTEIPAGVDDGVLTAREIAQLDLRGLDLLVLSACQTGLGEVGGDGVFGLQRGFKKAGARTILMSLREVDDNATRDMMIQFYNAYTAGRGKRDAFLRAQQYLKEHDADYAYSPATMRDEHPHWAAFILLDPLE